MILKEIQNEGFLLGFFHQIDGEMAYDSKGRSSLDEQKNGISKKDTYFNF